MFIQNENEAHLSLFLSFKDATTTLISREVNKKNIKTLFLYLEPVLFFYNFTKMLRNKYFLLDFLNYIFVNINDKKIILLKKIINIFENVFLLSPYSIDEVLITLFGYYV
ncbi:hypothetical protein LFWB_1410 [Candidatus Phytoplasma luffae]|uniref:Uncharacterized protein n=1 Tax=Loofah witches'-broom phytoplasma TaxID=35773 RepID=A0A975FIM0_LOWBP|nr:hypothetical protein LFWB_1410 [Candidatus Phytoplasma luffae]